MNKYRKVPVFLLTFLLLFLNFPVAEVKADVSKEKVDIVFMHDTHSHLQSFPTNVDGENVERGGYARIKSFVDEKRKENPNTFFFDGGDFSMGTLVQTVFQSEAAELRMLGAIGCDVTTLGNHEFDYRSEGLSEMLETAVESGDTLPAMVFSNVDWESMEAKGLTPEQQKLKDAFEMCGINNYAIVEKGDIRIGVIGIFGKDSLACAPTCVLEFKDPCEAAKETIEKLKQEENPDMIVCLSHSGTSQKKSKSEDEILAKEVPEIDLIISGHTHTTLEKPIRHGDTFIVSCGEYGKNIGSLSMSRKENGRFEMDQYELIPVDERIPEDEEILREIDGFIADVDQSYLARFGYTSDQILAENDIEFTPLEDVCMVHEEQNLGNLMADAYKYSAEHSESYDGIPVDVTVVPSGTVRDTYLTGNITVQNVFHSFSLGIGEDGVPGYPLISVYLTGKELKTVAEIDASVSDFMKTARLSTSGLQFVYNPHRMILNKVTDCYLVNGDDERVEIDDDKLYRVVVDLYSGQMIGAVTDVSHGLLSIVPKHADGTPITDYGDVILTENGKELKTWDAIARYMNSFEDSDGNGIGEVPAYYAGTQGRKVTDNSHNPVSLFKNPNRFSAFFFGIVVIIILILVSVILKIRKKIRNLFHK